MYGQGLDKYSQQTDLILGSVNANEKDKLSSRDREEQLHVKEPFFFHKSMSKRRQNIFFFTFTHNVHLYSTSKQE